MGLRLSSNTHIQVVHVVTCHSRLRQVNSTPFISCLSIQNVTGILSRHSSKMVLTTHPHLPPAWLQILNRLWHEWHTTLYTATRLGSSYLTRYPNIDLEPHERPRLPSRLTPWSVGSDLSLHAYDSTCYDAFWPHFKDRSVSDMQQSAP